MEKKARCVMCRNEISVPDSYAGGDQIRCGTCDTPHKVMRGDVLRLVLADVGPLRETIRQNQAQVRELEAELLKAKGSFGIGVNGLLAAVAYIVWQIGLRSRDVSVALSIEALLLAVVCGVTLEVLNYFFLAKRQTMTRLAAEIAQVRQEGRELQQKLRDATRR